MDLWKKDRGNDFKFIDARVKEVINMGGTGVYVHKYLSPKSASDEEVGELAIDDVLFLENRSRKYDDIIYQLRGHYKPADGDFDLTQFGLFLTNDVIFIEFHISEMVERVGRKLMSGDVLELPHLREFYTLDPDQPAFNKFFVIEDAARSAGGFDPRWWPHIWRVKARTITASEEYADIIGSTGEKILTDSDGNEIGKAPADTGHGGGDGDGTGSQSLIDIMSSANRMQGISDDVQAEAAEVMPWDQTYFEGHHYYIHFDDNDLPLIYYGTGDGIPPNGAELLGTGEDFPDDMQDDEYFLRTDFDRPTLYTKKGCKFIRVEVDWRQCWTGQNQLLDTFIDNENVTTHDDCETEPERQALSKAVLPRDGNGEE
jgi:hypothetical protein